MEIVREEVEIVREEVEKDRRRVGIFFEAHAVEVMGVDFSMQARGTRKRKRRKEMESVERKRA